MLSARCVCLLLALCSSLSLALESITTEDGYKIFATVPTKRYKLFEDELTWKEAVAACKEEGYGVQLVILESSQEADAVADILSKAITADTKQYAFAGINDIAVEGSWLTIAGGDLDDAGYNSWQEGQPDNFQGDEDCGGIRADGLYNDVKCSTPLRYICEKSNAEI